MLERLLLTFQCHIDRVIDLSNITILVGDNGAGKSAVIRSLRWLCLNEWEGKADDFFPWKCDKAEAALLLDSGNILIRRKSRKENIYDLNGEIFSAGSGVPDTINNILKVHPENFQDQDEPAFWLLLSAGQAAQALNEIFNLTDIDNANSYLGKELRENRSAIKTLNSICQEARSSLSDLEWVVQADRDLRELESLNSQIQKLDTQIDLLISCEDQLAQCEEERIFAQQMVKDAEEMLKISDQIEALDNKIKLHDDLIQEEQTQCRLQKELQAKQADLQKALSGACPLCGRGPSPSPRPTSTGAKSRR